MAIDGWDGKTERRAETLFLKDRVRMLEEFERAGTKSRGEMHRQIEEVKSNLKTGFKEVAEAINDLGIELQSTKGTCSVDGAPCAKSDIPWIKQWLTWIGAGEVALAAFMVSWMLTH